MDAAKVPAASGTVRPAPAVSEGIAKRRHCANSLGSRGMGDCIPLVRREPSKWQRDTGAIAHETLLSYKHKPRCHVLAFRLILSVSASTPSGSKRWPRKPHQYHQYQKNACRCPKDLIG